MNSAEVVHQTIAALWPLLSPESFALDIGSTDWVGTEGIHGTCLCLEDNILLHKYIRSTSPDHPAWLLAARRRAALRYILIVDHDSAHRDGGFAAAATIAIHQMAHAIRSDLAGSGFYPQATRLMEIDHYLQVQTREAEGTGESWRVPRPIWVQPDDVSVCGDAPSSSANRLGDERLLQELAAANDHCDSGHDLLFSLLLYRLEREARDRGALARQIRLEPSVFFPRVD
jgi:hypothetical protein